MKNFFIILGLLLFCGIIFNVNAEDRLNLDGVSIKGSHELPKVLYIVPWKNDKLGALPETAGSGSFDTSMKALDRDVFRRQVEYYDALYENNKTKSR